MIFNNNNRYFTSVGNGNHWGPNAGYTWSQNAVATGTNGQIVSGAWVPSQSDANGYLQVSVNNSANTNQKISSVGYVSGFSPFSGPQTIKSVQGYSATSSGNTFLQVYDGTTLIEPIKIQSGNNWFVNFGQNGALFNNFSIQNSTDPILNQQYAANDFFVTVIYQ
jgi:hypothetical protein